MSKLGHTRKKVGIGTRLNSCTTIFFLIMGPVPQLVLCLATVVHSGMSTVTLPGIFFFKLFCSLAISAAIIMNKVASGHGMNLEFRISSRWYFKTEQGEWMEVSGKMEPLVWGRKAPCWGFNQGAAETPGVVLCRTDATDSVKKIYKKMC